MADTFKYRAFISYSHAADGRLAPAVQSGLHQLAKPTFGLRAISVFRDRTDLSANPGLWPAIQRALDDSAFFILLASPKAAGSPWVEKEARHWLARDPTCERLLLVITDGLVEWDAMRGDFDWARSTALPPCLAGAFTDEPLHVDLQWARSDTDLSLRNTRFRDAILDLAAPLHGVAKADLDGEDVRRHRKAVAWRRAAVALLTLITIGLAIASHLAIGQRNLARLNAETAQANAIRANVGRKAALGLAELSANPRQGLVLALDAVAESDRQFREVTPDLQYGLATALLASRESFRTRAGILPTSLAATGDGSVVAIGSLDLVKLLSTDGRLLAAPLSAPGAGALSVNAIAVSPSGRFVATGSGLRTDDCSVRIWTTDGRLSRGPLGGFDRPVRAVAFSPDSTLLAAGGEDGRLRVWHADGTLAWERQGAHLGSINALAFAQDGRQLFSGGGKPGPPAQTSDSAEPAVRAWNVQTGTVLAERRTDGTVFALASQGDVVASGGSDGIVRLWDANRLTEQATGRGHAGPIRALAFDASGVFVASGGDDGRVGFWNRRGDLFGPLDSGHTGPVRGLAVLPGGVVLSTGDDGSIRRWEFLGVLASVGAAEGYVDAVALSPTGTRTIRLRNSIVGVSDFDARVLDERRIEVGPEELASKLAVARSGNLIAVAATSADLSSRILMATKEGPFREVLKGLNGPVTVLSFTPDDRVLVVGAGLPGVGDVMAGGPLQSSVALISSDTHALAASPQLDSATAISVAFAGEGSILLGDSRGRIHFFDASGQLARPSIETMGPDPDLPSSAVTAMALSPDRKTMAVANGPAIGGPIPSLLRLWDVAGNRETGTLAGHRQRINSLAFSPDGRVLASGGGEPEFNEGQRDYAVRLWAVQDGQLLAPELTAHARPVVGLAFDGPGGRLVSLDDSGTQAIWNSRWESWREIGENRSEHYRREVAAGRLQAEADALARAGDFAPALERLTRAVSEGNDEADIHWARARMLVALGRLQEALSEQTAAINRDPFNGVFLFERGKLRRRLGDLDGSLNDLTAAQPLAPFIIRPAPVIADSLPWNRAVSDSVQQASRIAIADVAFQRALTLLELRRFELARQDIDRAFALGLRSPGLFNARAHVRRAAGDESGAVEDERQASELDQMGSH